MPSRTRRRRFKGNWQRAFKTRSARGLCGWAEMLEEAASERANRRSDGCLYILRRLLLLIHQWQRDKANFSNGSASRGHFEKFFFFFFLLPVATDLGFLTTVLCGFKKNKKKKKTSAVVVAHAVFPRSSVSLCSLLALFPLQMV